MGGLICPGTLTGAQAQERERERGLPPPHAPSKAKQRERAHTRGNQPAFTLLQSPIKQCGGPGGRGVSQTPHALKKKREKKKPGMENEECPTKTLSSDSKVVLVHTCAEARCRTDISRCHLSELLRSLLLHLLAANAVSL